MADVTQLPPRTGLHRVALAVRLIDEAAAQVKGDGPASGYVLLGPVLMRRLVENMTPADAASFLLSLSKLAACADPTPFDPRPAA